VIGGLERAAVRGDGARLAMADETPSRMYLENRIQERNKIR